MPYVRVLSIGLVLLGLGWWLARGISAPRPMTPEPRSTHAWSTRFWIGAPTSAHRSSDAGAWALAEDGSVEPLAGGALAREITRRLCPESARSICDARGSVGCPSAAWIDEEPCAVAFESQCASWVERNYGAADDGFDVDEVALARCLRELREDVSSGEAITMSSACGELAHDPAVEGAACTFSWYACGRDGRCFDGLCRSNARLGELCIDEPCGPDLMCIADRCERPTPHGAACDESSVCAEREDGCIGGRCASHIADGEPCGYDEGCATSARCLRGVCTRVSTTSCSLGGECGRGRNCAGETEARCEPAAGAGLACVSYSDCGVLDCVDGRCAGGMALTAGRLPAGAECAYATSGQCAPGLACASGLDGYRCRTPHALGERCDEDAACAPDAVCVWRVIDGRCLPALCDVRDYFVDTGEE